MALRRPLSWKMNWAVQLWPCSLSRPSRRLLQFLLSLLSYWPFKRDIIPRISRCPPWHFFFFLQLFVCVFLLLFFLLVPTNDALPEGKNNDKRPPAPLKKSASQDVSFQQLLACFWPKLAPVNPTGRGRYAVSLHYSFQMNGPPFFGLSPSSFFLFSLSLSLSLYPKLCKCFRCVVQPKTLAVLLVDVLRHWVLLQWMHTTV